MNARTRRIVVLVATLFGAAATARLGVWQHDRASGKRELQVALQSRAAMPALGNADLSVSQQTTHEQQYRRIHLRGHWVAKDTVFLDNRQMEGRPGFFVVTPLALTGRSDAVLVQRGWAPRNADDRTAVPTVIDSDGEVEIDGRIAPPPGRLYDFGAPGAGSIRQNLPLGDYARETGLSLLPLSIEQLDSNARPAVDPSTTLLRKWPAPALDIDRNYGYMVQWFGMSALIVALYLWFQIIRPILSSTRSRTIANAEVR